MSKKPEQRIAQELGRLGTEVFHDVGEKAGGASHHLGQTARDHAAAWRAKERELAEKARAEAGQTASNATQTAQTETAKIEAEAAAAARRPQLALPPGNGGITLAQARRARGKAGGAAGEDYVRTMNGGHPERHYPVPMNNDPKYPVTTPGGRKVDVPVTMPNGDTLAIEVKSYQQYRTVKLPDGTSVAQKVEVPLSAHIKEQIHKDIALRNADPHYDPRWEFVGAGPNDELRKYLTEAKFIFVEHH